MREETVVGTTIVSAGPSTKNKASIRAKVESPFSVIKNLFDYRKVRYKGLAKNQTQLLTLFALGS